MRYEPLEFLTKARKQVSVGPKSLKAMTLLKKLEIKNLGDGTSSAWQLTRDKHVTIRAIDSTVDSLVHLPQLFNK